MSATTTATQRAERFAEYLQGFVDAEDRAALAALRRGLGKDVGEVPEMYPFVVPWVTSLPPWEESAFYQVAALFALHPDYWPSPEGERFPSNNLGASCRRLTLTDEGKYDAERMKRVERRFVALLNCHSDDLDEHLRRIVGLLKSRDIPINYAQLLRDILGWWRADRRVQRNWAQAFWGSVDQPSPRQYPLLTEQRGKE